MRVGSNSSSQCIYHLFSLFARRLPTQYIVVAALIGAFMAFNCVYGLIANRRQIVTHVGTRLTSLRALTPRQQQQQQQGGQSGHQVERGYEKQPLLTTTAQQQQQQPQMSPSRPGVPSLQLDQGRV